MASPHPCFVCYEQTMAQREVEPFSSPKNMLRATICSLFSSATCEQMFVFRPPPTVFLSGCATGSENTAAGARRRGELRLVEPEASGHARLLQRRRHGFYLGTQRNLADSRKRFGLVWFGLVWVWVSVWFGLVWVWFGFGLVCFLGSRKFGVGRCAQDLRASASSLRQEEGRSAIFVSFFRLVAASLCSRDEDGEVSRVYLLRKRVWFFVSTRACVCAPRFVGQPATACICNLGTPLIFFMITRVRGKVFVTHRGSGYCGLLHRRFGLYHVQRLSLVHVVHTYVREDLSFLLKFFCYVRISPPLEDVVIKNIVQPQNLQNMNLS